MLKNSFLERDCHAHLFNHNNMIENEISCGTNILKHRFSKHCSKVKEPTHHPRLLPSKHAKQNSGRARLYSSSRSRGLYWQRMQQAQCKSNKSAVLRSKRTGGFCASRALPLGSSYTYGTRLLHYYCVLLTALLCSHGPREVRILTTKASDLRTTRQQLLAKFSRLMALCVQGAQAAVKSLDFLLIEIPEHYTAVHRRGAILC